MTQKNEKKNTYANLALILVAFVWGSGFVVTKGILDKIPTYYLLSYRFLISFLIISIAYHKKFKEFNKENVKAGLFLGVLMFLGFVSQTIGLNYTTVGKQAFITASNVVMVPFISWAISKRKPDTYDVLGAFFCFLGIAIISLDGNLSLGIGELLSFLGAFFFATHTAAIGHFAKDNCPIVLSILQMLMAGVLAITTALLVEGQPVLLTSETFWPIIYLAFFSTFLAFLVQNVAQKYTSPTNAAMILSLEAVFGTVLGIILLKDPFNTRMLVGFSLVFISIIIAETKLAFLKPKQFNKR